MHSFLKPLMFFKNLIVTNVVSLIILVTKNRVKYSIPENSNKNNILFNTQYHTYHSWVDYTLAAALKYRGHKVKILICDGAPYCEQETKLAKRPNCKSCYKNTHDKVKLFGIDTIKLSKLVSKEERKGYFNLSKKISVDNLIDYKFMGVDVGKIAYRNFIHYFKGSFKIDVKKESIFRNCFESALLVCGATNNYLSKNKIDKIITTNGKFIQSGIAIDLAKFRAINFYTWDFFTQNSAFIFAKNNIAHDQEINDVWDNIKNKPLDVKQLNEVETFYNLQSKSLTTPFRYYDESVIRDSNEIKLKLDLRKNSKVITLFTNVEWDSTAMGQDHAFLDMFHWVKSMVELAISNQDIDLIIRAHPGETKVPKQLQSQAKICDRLIDEFQTIPENVKLVKPDDNISSYILADISDVVMVYTSTLGLEFALMGIRSWVIAKSYYANKGFTLDITSHAQLIDMIKNQRAPKKLTMSEIKLAKRFAYAIKFRRLFNYPVFNKKGKLQLFNYKILLPDNKRDNVIGNICNFIEDEVTCLDLGPSAVRV